MTIGDPAAKPQGSSPEGASERCREAVPSIGRPPSRGELVAALLLMLVGLLAPWLLADGLPTWLRAPAPFLDVVGRTFAVVVVALPLAGPAVIVGLLRRHRGACRLEPGALAFEVPLGGAVRIPRGPLGRVDTPWGVRLLAPSRGRLAEWTAPLVLHAPDDDARGRVHAALDDPREAAAIVDPTPSSRGAIIALAAGVLLPVLVQVTVVSAFARMYREVGTANPRISELACEGVLSLTTSALALLASVLWTGVSPRRQGIATLLALLVGGVTLAWALYLPLTVLISPL